MCVYDGENSISYDHVLTKLALDNLDLHKCRGQQKNLT